MLLYYATVRNGALLHLHELGFSKSDAYYQRVSDWRTADRLSKEKQIHRAEVTLPSSCLSYRQAL